MPNKTRGFMPQRRPDCGSPISAPMLTNASLFEILTIMGFFSKLFGRTEPKPRQTVLAPPAPRESLAEIMGRELQRRLRIFRLQESCQSWSEHFRRHEIEFRSDAFSAMDEESYITEATRIFQKVLEMPAAASREDIEKAWRDGPIGPMIVRMLASGDDIDEESSQILDAYFVLKRWRTTNK